MRMNGIRKYYIICCIFDIKKGQKIADEEEFGSIRPVEDANVGDFVVVNSSTCEFGYPFWVGKITSMDTTQNKASAHIELFGQENVGLVVDPYIYLL